MDWIISMFMWKCDVPFEDEPLFSIRVMGLRIMEKNHLPSSQDPNILTHGCNISFCDVLMTKLETTSWRCRSGSRWHLTWHSSASAQVHRLWMFDDGFEWDDLLCTMLPLRLLHEYYRLGIWKYHRRTKFAFKAPKGCARLFTRCEITWNMPQTKCFIYLHIDMLQPSV